jgi:hypothetical protein
LDWCWRKALAGSPGLLPLRNDSPSSTPILHRLRFNY